MFITQDKLCDGTPWHKRTVPADPARDPYFPLDQASLTLTTEGPTLRVRLKTLTPNFKTYLIRVDGGEWNPEGETFAWVPRTGASRLEIKTVNRFGIEGPTSTVELELKTRKKDVGAHGSK
ncbi:MAG: hypothetical protein JWM97_1000, partial [Phycisphaerales bacterium]|nr:hypothetical protein [Phycisphaerales bacterium]